MLQSEFVRRFKCLGSLELNQDGFNILDKAVDILDKQDMPSTAFKLGSSMVCIYFNDLRDYQPPTSCSSI